MSIARCKELLPFPRLLSKLGIETDPPLRADKMVQVVCSPLRSEGTGSFNVKIEHGKWFWFDHGDNAGGDEVTFIERYRACEKKEAIRLYHELAGIEMEKPKREGKAKGAMGKIVRTYDYLNPDGKLLFQVCRFEPKNFMQRRPAARGMTAGNKEAKQDRGTGQWWLWTLHGIEPVLYRLPELIERFSEPVWICEGEKDADCLHEHGLLATTAPMGSKKWRDSYTDILARREVMMCPDSDAAGRGHAKLVIEALKLRGCKVRVVNWRGIVASADEEKWDAAKYVADL